jgi:hypothetical protein
MVVGFGEWVSQMSTAKGELSLATTTSSGVVQKITREAGTGQNGDSGKPSK